MRLLIGCILFCLASMGSAQSKESTKQARTHEQACLGGKRIVPDGLRIVCSGSWQMRGKCDGTDQWDKWRVTGQTNPADSFIRPWESTPIAVIGYGLMRLLDDSRADTKARYANERLSWFMVGSGMNAQPDSMLWLGPGQTVAQQIWPSGFGQLWPSKQDASRRTKFEDIVTVHGACFGGSDVMVYLTIYYSPLTRERAPPTPR